MNLASINVEKHAPTLLQIQRRPRRTDFSPVLCFAVSLHHVQNQVRSSGLRHPRVLDQLAQAPALFVSHPPYPLSFFGRCTWWIGPKNLFVEDVCEGTGLYLLQNILRACHHLMGQQKDAVVTQGTRIAGRNISVTLGSLSAVLSRSVLLVLFAPSASSPPR